MVDHDYVERAVNNLLEGLKLLTDQDDKPIARLFLTYLTTPPQYPAIMLYPGGGRTDLEDGVGEPYQEQIYTVIIRHILGKVGEKYEGKLLKSLWYIQPAVLNHINTHKTLVFSDQQAHISELRSSGVRATAISRLGIIRDDPEHIGMEYSVTLPFHIELEAVWLPDD